MDAIGVVSREQIEAEQYFAGAVFTHGEHARKEVSWLLPDVFMQPNIKIFWERVLAGEHPVEVGFDLKMAPDLIEWGNATFFLDVTKYANALSKKYFLRNSIVGATDIVRAAQAGDEVEIHNILDVMTSLNSGGSNTMRTPSEVAESLNRRIEQGNISIPWGIESVDYATRGSERGTLTIVAGRPSMGKSSLVFQVNEYQALELKLRVGVWALEMSGEQMFARRNCFKVDKAWMDVRSGGISAVDQESLNRYVEEYGAALEGHMWVDDRTSTTTADIVRTQLKENFDVLMVDHLGLLKDPRQKGERTDEYLGRLTRTLHELAKNTKSVVLLVAQLNRGVEQRQDKIPTMADLRDSGKIEENADNVFLLYRENYYDYEVDNNFMQIRFGKARDGVKGSMAWVDYDTSKQVFTSLTEEEIDAISDEELEDPQNPENKKNFVQEEIPF